MTAYIFPGQGSQAPGMGKELFSKFQPLVAEADAILGYSIETLCLSDPNQQLNQTQFTQPALYVVNALTYLDKVQTAQTKPAYFAGHSLGEYNALFAANVFDFATGLKLVKKRGELMSQAASGGMAAVIGLNAETIQNVLATHHLTRVTIANYNSYMQLVISGQQNEVVLAQSLFEQAGAKMVIPLKVSGAFHSPLMQASQNEFKEFIKSFQFNAPSVPVISNVTAKPYKVNEIHTNLAQQISNPVRWTESIDYLLAQGMTEFEEVGPGSVLTGLVRRIKNKQ